MKSFLVCCLFLLASAPAFAQTRMDLLMEKPLLDRSSRTVSLFTKEGSAAAGDHLDYFTITNLRDKGFERRRVREEWKDFLGFDAFYPYYKVQEIKDIVSDKTVVRIMNIKGKAEFNDDLHSVRYIFKKRF